MSEPPSSNFLTIPQFCERYQVSPASVYRLLHRGLPSVKMPGLGRRILAAEADAFLRSPLQRSSPSYARLPRPKKPRPPKSLKTKQKTTEIATSSVGGSIDGGGGDPC